MTNEEAIAMLKSKMDGSVDTSYEWAETVRMAIESLQDKATGVWVDKGGYSECSECGEVAQSMEFYDGVYERLTNYCPNCGARMI